MTEIIDVDLEKYNYSAYIVGAGYSLKNFDFSLLNDKFVIAVNVAYTALPNANICFVTDPPLIKTHLQGLQNHKAPVYQGVLKINNPPKLPVVDLQFKLTGPTGLDTNPYNLKHGSNSCYSCINLCFHLKFKHIYLLGVDMKWAKKGDRTTSHFHNDKFKHQRLDGEAVYQKMLANYKTIKQPLLANNVKVVNLNTPDGTDLKEFPIVSIEEHFKLNQKI